MPDTQSVKSRRITLPFGSVDDKPYIFASYGHNDKERVFPYLKELYEAGYNVWYDEGITIGEKYDEVIADHIRNSAVFLLFASKWSLSRPYILDTELPTANKNPSGKPWALFIEDDVIIPDKAESLISEKRFCSLEQVFDELCRQNIQNFGKREAMPVERDVPLLWLEGHSLDPAGGGKNIVLADEEPYACLAFDPADLTACNPYAKELFFAGFNVRSCENCDDAERKAMLEDPNCRAYVPFVTENYVKSGQLEKDYKLAREAGKKLIALYIEKEGDVALPSGIADEFSAIQGINIKELTDNDFLSKIEIELEGLGCYASMKDGKVERRSFEIPGFLYDFTEDGNCINLTKYTGNQEDVVINKSYGGYPVVELNFTFYENKVIRSVRIPSTVTRIGTGTFSECGIQDVYIPSSVTYISDGAFGSETTERAHYCDVHCTKFSYAFKFATMFKYEYKNLYDRHYDLYVDGSQYLGVVIDPEIYAAEGLANHILPKNIPLYSFTENPDGSIILTDYNGCEDNIKVPREYKGHLVVGLGEGLFNGCFFAETVAIPESVNTIGKNAFNGCCNLKSVNIPSGVTSIGDYAFSECKNLTIYCPEGSTAWQYCEQNNIPHKPLEHPVQPAKAPSRVFKVEPAAAPAHAPIAQAKPVSNKSSHRSPARWLIPVILLALLAAAAGVQLSGLFDILGWLGGLL